ncbi:leucine-rich repeat-containing protein 58-like [Artemia franciscana]|uniref:Disease resistance R13L4/SHOC-2-like LRR domain-containing protein n=1 Tax=Artemia franciscana TaxID=6661 RepID=A0AA88H883_ARTSF|nr:hypothetical protein QYM36_014988 [Artemia franciscana]KAK2707155.1 hypothetical protein QYM36_014988 [Artemia franciscana]
MASIYSSDSSDTQEPKTPNRSLDLSYLRLDNLAMGRTMEQIALVPNESTESSECQTQQVSEKTGLYETILLLHNDLVTMPVEVLYFHNLRLLDLSSNSLTFLPDVIIELKHLTSLIIKNNCLDENGLPKNFGRLRLRELNLSGNHFTRFPEQVYDMTTLKYLYIGGGSITGFSGRIAKLQRLQILYLGGNQLQEIPAQVGLLSHLQVLNLSENHLESLPTSIAALKQLKSLLLHKNRLTTLPQEIAKLGGLMELSLRDNPLVVRFVREMVYSPPSLMEIAARIVKVKNIPFNMDDIPSHLKEYLQSAHHCVNPKCKGVFFDTRVEHVKFVDFCGKYRIPLMHYLCSRKCTTARPAYNNDSSDSDSESQRLKRVLLG